MQHEGIIEIVLYAVAILARLGMIYQIINTFNLVRQHKRIYAVLVAIAGLVYTWFVSFSTLSAESLTIPRVLGIISLPVILTVANTALAHSTRRLKLKEIQDET